MSSAVQLVSAIPQSGPLAEPPQWYAIRTRSRFEKKVAAELEHRGIESFLPVQQQVRKWSDRRKLVSFPLFPGYAFVRIAPVPRMRVLVASVPGVVSFVGTHHRPMAIPAGEIEHIQTLVLNNIQVTGEPFPRIGQRVRISGGVLDGLEGVLVGTRGERRFVVSVCTIERSISFCIEGYELEAI
ncbi:MAG TPA: UpxY family transcription antiterminator [Terriglobales bacterium]|nr:UpxY family transcription antiterminator [Terriglobales bacterium]